jgi:Flp pilus assembly protein TadD
MAIGRRVVAASRPNPADRVQTANFWFPGISEAFAATGDIGAAQALAAEFGPACDRCRVARGTIARDSGDWGAAQAWYRRAQAAAPSLADADLAWGQALLARNDPDGAIAHARAAHAKSPKWAEPLLLWGEALAAKRDPAAALAQYRAAEALAPKWGRIQLRMGQALAAKGDASRASQRLAEAARRELSPDDRAELDRILLKTP